jgi:hypothetical protein
MGKFMAINFDDLIQGEKFRCLNDGVNLFYKNTHEVNDFLLNPPKQDFILISHNSDGKIKDKDFRITQGSSNDANITNIPKNLITWFGQNVCVEHEKIISIPIGLENSEWFAHINKKEKIKQKHFKPKTYKNLLYVCHNIKTNFGERLEPYEIFKDKKWVTLEHGTNGNNFDEYLDNLHSHKFVLCPEGNGTDTHRTWETLYVGSIPIEKRNNNNRFYDDLPICFVNEWSEITEDFLNEEYKKIKSNEWNLEKLNFTFWKNKINKIKNKLC